MFPLKNDIQKTKTMTNLLSSSIKESKTQERVSLRKERLNHIRNIKNNEKYEVDYIKEYSYIISIEKNINNKYIDVSNKILYSNEVNKYNNIYDLYINEGTVISTYTKDNIFLFLSAVKDSLIEDLKKQPMSNEYYNYDAYHNILLDLFQRADLMKIQFLFDIFQFLYINMLNTTVVFKDNVDISFDEQAKFNNIDYVNIVLYMNVFHDLIFIKNEFKFKVKAKENNHTSNNKNLFNENSVKVKLISFIHQSSFLSHLLFFIKNIYKSYIEEGEFRNEEILTLSIGILYEILVLHSNFLNEFLNDSTIKDIIYKIIYMTYGFSAQYEFKYIRTRENVCKMIDLLIDKDKNYDYGIDKFLSKDNGIVALGNYSNVMSFYLKIVIEFINNSQEVVITQNLVKNDYEFDYLLYEIISVITSITRLFFKLSISHMSLLFQSLNNDYFKSIFDLLVFLFKNTSFFYPPSNSFSLFNNLLIQIINMISNLTSSDDKDINILIKNDLLLNYKLLLSNIQINDSLFVFSSSIKGILFGLSNVSSSNQSNMYKISEFIDIVVNNSSMFIHKDRHIIKELIYILSNLFLSSFDNIVKDRVYSLNRVESEYSNGKDDVYYKIEDIINFGLDYVLDFHKEVELICLVLKMINGLIYFENELINKEKIFNKELLVMYRERIEGLYDLFIDDNRRICIEIEKLMNFIEFGILIENNYTIDDN